MAFKVNDKVHLLNSIDDIMYGNRGTVEAVILDIPTGIETYEVYFKSINETIIVSAKDIDLYNNPHLSSAFTMEVK